MLKKTITFTDYDGNVRTEDFYFHLNKSELIKWMITSGDYTFDRVLVRLSESKNGKEIMKHFEDLIRLSYGVKSLDGRKFIKNEEVWSDFYNTEAYSVLFTELVTDGKKAGAFVNGIIPKDLQEAIEKEMAENVKGIPNTIRDYIPEIGMATTEGN